MCAWCVVCVSWGWGGERAGGLMGGLGRGSEGWKVGIPIPTCKEISSKGRC